MIRRLLGERRRSAARRTRKRRRIRKRRNESGVGRGRGVVTGWAIVKIGERTVGVRPRRNGQTLGSSERGRRSD